ncbi:MAG: class I SAM-dependent methyltransferase [bacterium]|nr:class I SAM-dependent methyltransferase [bacterium]
MPHDNYNGFAQRYDRMRRTDPQRESFFEKQFRLRNITSVLDCACGTGQDLLMLQRQGLAVCGSDLSPAMLEQARLNHIAAGIEIPLHEVDFTRLPEHFETGFDAVICLNNSINELLEDAATLSALRSMRSVLRDGGLLMIDQGQTDASMQDPPAFVPIVNNRDFSRLFTIEYAEQVQTVNIFDFTHTESEESFAHAAVRIRIRLQDSWAAILAEAGFTNVEFYGDWAGTSYCKTTSKRLILLAAK